MKKLIFAILIGSLIGYFIGNSQRKEELATLSEDIAHLSDFVRWNMDYLEGDTTLPNEYVWSFEEQETNLLYRESGVAVPLKNYSYCY